jgi:hypothetical protein
VGEQQQQCAVAAGQTGSVPRRSMIGCAPRVPSAEAAAHSDSAKVMDAQARRAALSRYAMLIARLCRACRRLFFDI